MADHLGDALVQPTDPALVGVFRTDFLECGVRNVNLLRRDAPQQARWQLAEPDLDQVGQRDPRRPGQLGLGKG